GKRRNSACRGGVGGPLGTGGGVCARLSGQPHTVGRDGTATGATVPCGQLRRPWRRRVRCSVEQEFLPVGPAGRRSCSGVGLGQPGSTRAPDRTRLGSDPNVARTHGGVARGTSGFLHFDFGTVPGPCGSVVAYAAPAAAACAGSGGEPTAAFRLHRLVPVASGGRTRVAQRGAVCGDAPDGPYGASPGVLRCAAWPGAVS